MAQATRKFPVIQARTEALLKEAGEIGDGFLECMYGMALRHLEDRTAATELHEQPEVQTPPAKALYKQLWSAPTSRPEPHREGAMRQLDRSGAGCRSCRFWSGRGMAAGECRRFPPDKKAADGSQPHSAWAQTMGDQWCGEWQVAVAQPVRGGAAGCKK